MGEERRGRAPIRLVIAWYIGSLWCLIMRLLDRLNSPEPLYGVAVVHCFFRGYSITLPLRSLLKLPLYAVESAWNAIRGADE